MDSFGLSIAAAVASSPSMVARPRGEATGVCPGSGGTGNPSSKPVYSRSEAGISSGSPLSVSQMIDQGDQEEDADASEEHVAGELHELGDAAH